jgi:hypothetical protein
VCAKGRWLLIYSVRELNSVAVVVTVELWKSSGTWSGDES